MLLGAFQETKRKLDECRSELTASQRKLHNTRIKVLVLETEAMKSAPKTLKKSGDEVTFCMTDFSMHKQTGKVWHSPPFYFRDGYKLCLAVYANGKGAGAGTHVSVELLQMRGEHDHKLTWLYEGDFPHCHPFEINISIQMMAQCKNTLSQKKNFSLESQLNLCCTKRLSPHENLRVCQHISKDQFIDHKSAEQLMVF